MSQQPTRWNSGDEVVLRFVGHDDGMVIGQPHVVVTDTPEELVLFQPAGVTIENRRYTAESPRAIAFGEPQRELPPTFVPEIDTLRILPTGASHGIELLYGFAGQPNPGYLRWADPSSSLRGVKINLQAASRRTSIGIDSTDNVLDLTVRNDLQWAWKDAEQVRDRLGVGLVYPEELAAFYAEAESVIAQIEGSCGHFAGGFARWAHWRPDPTWPHPVLPAGWQHEPGADHDLNRRVPLPS